MQKGSSEQVFVEFFVYYLDNVADLSNAVADFLYILPLGIFVTFANLSGCLKLSAPSYCSPLYEFASFIKYVMEQALTLIFLILTSPIGLIAIVLDAFNAFSPVGIGLLTDENASESSSIANIDSNSSFPILTEVKESFVAVKCQFELMQCQIKNIYIGLKSALMAKGGEATP
jgi:hypothetical protein